MQEQGYTWHKGVPAKQALFDAHNWLARSQHMADRVRAYAAEGREDVVAAYRNAADPYVRHDH